MKQLLTQLESIINDDNEYIIKETMDILTSQDKEIKRLKQDNQKWVNFFNNKPKYFGVTDITKDKE